MKPVAGPLNKRYLLASHKLSMAVHSLAVSPEDIRGRLPRVYNLLADLSVNDFPKAIQEDFEWVMSKFTARKPRWTDRDFPDTSARASIAAIRGKQATQKVVEIAERIVRISDMLQTISMTPEEDKAVRGRKR
jgi:hypothetical protein